MLTTIEPCKIPEMNGNKALSTLLKKAEAGDRNALALAVDLHREKLCRALKASLDWRILKREDPEDLFQLAHLQAQKRWPEYLKKQDCPFFVWLYGLVRQVRFDTLGRNTREKRSIYKEEGLARCFDPQSSLSLLTISRVVIRDPRPTPLSEQEQQERAALVRGAILKLRPVFREVLVLLYFTGFKGTEAAQIIGISDELLRKRHERALGDLEKHLKALKPRGSKLA